MASWFGIRRAFLCDRAIVAWRARVFLRLFVLFCFFGVGGTPSAFAAMFLMVAAAFACFSIVLRSRYGLEKSLLWQPPWRVVFLVLGFALIWQLAGSTTISWEPLALVRALFAIVLVAALAVLVQESFLRDAYRFLDPFLAFVFAAGSVSAACAIGLFVWNWSGTSVPLLNSLAHARLEPIGRNRNEIVGAGALACALFAGLCLAPAHSVWRKLVRSSGIAVIILALVMTQSRGPILGVIAACLTTFAMSGLRKSDTRKLIGLAMAFVCFAVPILLIVFEPVLKLILCEHGSFFCRESGRLDVWIESVSAIASKPVFGFGPDFRFPGDGANHPHNSLLGMMMYFGIPVAAALLWLYGAALKRALSDPMDRDRRFVFMSLVFCAAYAATGQSNLLGDLNAHHLFFWFPLLLAFSLPAADVGTTTRERP